MAASSQYTSVSSNEADVLRKEVAVHGAGEDGGKRATTVAKEKSDAVPSDRAGKSPDDKGPSLGKSFFQRDGDNPWELAQEVQKEDEIVEATVTGHNKGGLLVRWCSLQGFIPASQLIELSGLHVKEERMAQLEARHGEVLQLKLIEVDAESNRLIFSERATEVTASARDDLLRELAPGQVRMGVVTNLADFGAFVDLGGVEGLLHISELSWRRLTHPGDVVRPGQKLNVLVMDVDVQRGRVALSRKKLRQDPWIGVEERYRAGQQLTGVVTNVADFGVFVLLEEGLEGLLHVSELDAVEGEDPLRRITRGTRLGVQVIYVSEHKRRLALTLMGDKVS